MNYHVYRNEKGIALITTLLLMVLGFAVVVTLLLMVTQGAKISGIEQRYTAALEASKGGSDFVINMIRNDLTIPPNIAGAAGASGSACLQEKLTKTTANWTACASDAATTSTADDPDLTLNLNGYQVLVKFIDTRETSTAYIYTINVRSQLPNSTEHAEISFLYEQEK